jgi:SAM-dependent methyltransferase
LPDSGADGVLMMGPLYHLTGRDDRLRAWREAVRVARPGGVVAGAVISRFASLCDGFAKGFFAEPGFAGIVAGALADGVHRNPDAHPRWFTSAYFHHPAEPAAEAAEAGLTGVRTLAVEGPAWMTSHLPAFVADPELTELTLTMLRRVEEEPSLAGASSHLLTVGRVR